MSRIHNFSAGPAVLPVPVLEEAREALLDFNGSGIGIMECSHRTPLFEQVIDSARARLKRLLSLDDDQEVLFLQGGASSQFFMVPMNLLNGGRATYLDTGVWSKKAIAEAKRFGTVDVPFSSAARAYDRVPTQGEWGALPQGTAYLHYTSNNTVAGTQYHYVPETDVPLVCDVSSDIACRPVDGSRFALMYAGAQKNLGPSGVTVVVVRKSLLERCGDVPTMLSYNTHVKDDSMYNTPNTWGIYIIDRVCAWVEDMGGPAVMASRNQAQAGKIYEAIDQSSLYRGLAEVTSRSLMNVTFTTGSADLDTAFCKAADDRGLSGLKGHRVVGGLRASIYNAQTDEAIDALVDFLAEFERTHR